MEEEPDDSFGDKGSTNIDNLSIFIYSQTRL
jgi:hypothetical protein